jgi:signal transduction histidine kinase
MTETARILVIDDEIGVCEGVRRALAPVGYQVDITTSGEDSLEIIRKGSFELILLDVMMPDVNGINLIASIHEHDPEIVCIIITGYATVELAVEAIKQGAYDFLTKPFSVDDLRLAVSQGLERRRLSLDAKRAAAAEAEARQLAIEKEQLEELGHAKQQFINLVTHELKSPISAIQNYLYLIRDGYVSADEQANLIQKCLLRTDEELTLIGDLLELGKIQANEEKARQSTASLKDALDDVLKASKEQLSRKQLKLEASVTGPIPLVTGLQEQLKSLWGNLIDNAIKYTPENGHITVKLHAEQGEVIGEVSDTGIGIPPEDQEKLFREFFRAGNAKALEIQGSGLGLVIVKRIVEAAGGKISVDSAPGCGSTFTFRIPIAAKS